MFGIEALIFVSQSGEATLPGRGVVRVRNVNQVRDLPLRTTVSIQQLIHVTTNLNENRTEQNHLIHSAQESLSRSG